MGRVRQDYTQHRARREISLQCPPRTREVASAVAPRNKTPSSNAARSVRSISAPTVPIAPAAAASARTAARALTTTENRTMTTKTLTTTTDAVSSVSTPRPNLTKRPRRLGRTEGIRTIVRETVVRPEDLIYPLFVVPNTRPKVEIGSMPGVFQLRAREIAEDARRAYDAGIRAVLLFGLPEYKDGIGSASWDPTGPVQSAIATIKRAVPQMAVMADVCLCEYTDHGHCGVLVERNGVTDV